MSLRFRLIGLVCVVVLTQGRNLVQMADALGIGYKPAANNCSQIRAKLRADSTADLIPIAIQHGLADRDASRN